MEIETDLTDGWIENDAVRMLADIGVHIVGALALGVVTLIVAAVFLSPLAAGVELTQTYMLGPDPSVTERQNASAVGLTMGLIFEFGMVLYLWYSVF